MQDLIAKSVADIESVKAVFVTAMPDCLLYDSWVRDEGQFVAEEVATYFGDLVRANRQGLKALGSMSSDMQVTIEAANDLIVLRELNADFVCSCVFDRSAALGMIRLHMNRLIDRITETLPSFDVEKRPRGVRIIEFLHRYSPDPHAVILRASLRTGIPVESLESADELTDEEVEQLEQATRSLLGLATLNL